MKIFTGQKIVKRKKYIESIVVYQKKIAVISNAFPVILMHTPMSQVMGGLNSQIPHCEYATISKLR